MFQIQNHLYLKYIHQMILKGIFTFILPGNDDANDRVDDDDANNNDGVSDDDAGDAGGGAGGG